MKAYEAGTPSYFATPPVQLILALHASLSHIVKDYSERIRLHVVASDAFKARIERMGLKLVPTHLTHAAHTLSAIYYPESVKDIKLFLSKIGECGVMVAGGLHADHATKYFRVGHMSISAIKPELKHVERTLDAIEFALKACGHVFP